VRNLLIYIFLFFCLQSLAQEKLMPIMAVEKDSAQIELERQILYRQLLSGTLQSGGLMSALKFQAFSLNSMPLQTLYNFNPNELFISGNLVIPDLNTFGFPPSPFLREGTVFSSAAYKLNNKFNVSGYSFGANSIFSAPLPNQRMNNFDARGATMFMQYKVSKNVKIETRISVTQGNGPGFIP
jgi:hypothetical protein